MVEADSRSGFIQKELGQIGFSGRRDPGQRENDRDRNGEAYCDAGSRSTLRDEGSRLSILQHRIADGGERVSRDLERGNPAVGLQTGAEEAGFRKRARKGQEQRNGHHPISGS